MADGSRAFEICVTPAEAGAHPLKFSFTSTFIVKVEPNLEPGSPLPSLEDQAFALAMTYSLAPQKLTTRSIWLAWPIFLLKNRSGPPLKTSVRSRQGSKGPRPKTKTLLVQSFCLVKLVSLIVSAALRGSRSRSFLCRRRVLSW